VPVSEIRVSGLNVFPIKACGRVELEESYITSSGLEYDRLFMLIDSKNKMITQRNLRLAPKLVQIQPVFGKYDGEIIGGKNNGMLHVHANDFGTLDLSLFMPPYHTEEQAEKLPDRVKPKRLELVEADIHNTTAVGAVVGDEANGFFSEYLGQHVRLLRAMDQNLRQIKPDRQIEGASPFTGFADGYPILLASQASHNQIAAHPAVVEEFGEGGLPIDRWRSNIEIEGEDLEAYDEGKWRRIKFGKGLSALVVKPCIRCVIPQTDQDTGERSKAVKTALQESRWGVEHGQDEHGMFFGENLIIVKAGGRIALMDTLTVEEEAEESNVILFPHGKPKQPQKKAA
jgi:uncharacterized protein YcbX